MNVVVVGSGNVATHLAKAFLESTDVNVQAILSRDNAHAEDMARRIGFEGFAGDDWKIIDTLRPDVVLVSVADKGMTELTQAIGRLESEPMIVHTSGTVPKEVLLPVSGRVGVFYPFQTFSKEVPVDVASVPIFTEVSDESDHELLDRLASSITRFVRHADAAKRNRLHIAGVFSCNFTNYLLEITQGYLEKNGMSLGDVESLVRTTIDKAFRIGPHKAQTGPAVRGDMEVMKRQHDSLDEPMKDLYSQFSRLIMETHHIDNEQDKL